MSEFSEADLCKVKPGSEFETIVARRQTRRLFGREFSPIPGKNMTLYPPKTILMKHIYAVPHWAGPAEDEITREQFREMLRPDGALDEQNLLDSKGVLYVWMNGEHRDHSVFQDTASNEAARSDLSSGIKQYSGSSEYDIVVQEKFVQGTRVEEIRALFWPGRTSPKDPSVPPDACIPALADLAKHVSEWRGLRILSCGQGEGRSQILATLVDTIEHLNTRSSRSAQVPSSDETQAEIQEMCGMLKTNFSTTSKRLDMSPQQTMYLNHLLAEYHGLEPSVSGTVAIPDTSSSLPPLDIRRLDSISGLIMLTMDRRNRRRMCGETQEQFDYAVRTLASILLERSEDMLEREAQAV